MTILVAMLGWAHSGARTPNYSDWFGLFHVPQITSPDKEAARLYEDRHIFFAYVLLALIVIHLRGGALAPLRPARPRSPRGWSSEASRRSELADQLSPNTRLKIVSTCLK